ncbi:redoxin family protein [Sphingomonas pseudosanguinis]|uniref:Cytochrome c biogenesis protein CcmG/thiol:disulfide interchange protein DsbE n=1 Tax=Sphingomonas pseudosanguinis TaxID=413712 RepID=A0A7W6ABF5_9SPHN|nr:redoxin family protein [Sphingomonas pseudosanguinis]MBB3879605.1 cytochrome c biogenesis protein CcmG/thiol:disulfide interchange protein DsbE [Sphingomonas pseudosanguinis]MBN3538301.1 redoxin family protein [Sphingomonas pseudosanguinis]
MKRWLIWAPLAVFGALFAVVAAGLMRPADTAVHSTLVDKPLPSFELEPMVPGKSGLASTDFGRGTPHLLNVFASWCIPCIAEAPQLMRLKARGIPIDAIAIHDKGPAVVAFLRRNGDPYDRIGDDSRSRVQLSLGSSGVPETFLIDGRGRIVRQYIGDIRADQVDQIVRDVAAAR